MRFKTIALVGAFLVVAACGPKDESAQYERFDAAVQEMSTAYFSHVPEAATQLGLSEELAPGTGHRMMDRSIDGNAARNQALEATLAGLTAIDAESLSPDRQRTHAVVTTLFEGMLSPSRSNGLTMWPSS